MNSSANNYEDLYVLLDDYCDGKLSPSDAARLDAILRNDSAARREYLAYLDVHAGLGLLSGKPPYSGFDDETAPPSAAAAVMPSPLALSPAPFVGGPVFSYIAATLILGVMLLGAWAYKISHDYGTSLATNSRGLTAPGEPAQRPDPIFVARVTGMKDCRWADPATETYAGAAVPLGRKYSLSSGLMEITYLSGAKVILEGPCSYEVESSAGGFLALGKLTAKVEKRSEVKGRRSEPGGLAASAASVQPQASITPAPSPKPQAPRPKTEISKSPHLQISKFAVRTPTAVVTDLGTEFGVEVAANGDTTSHVFQGSIVVKSLAAASTRRELSSQNPKSQIPNQQILLSAGQSARVEKDADTGETRIATGRQAGVVPEFVRRIHEPPKTLDLLDIVAGGNGLGHRRERGIDPASGLEDTVFFPRTRDGDGRYRPVAWHRLIDGAFVPDGGQGAVQLDSAGHSFDGFPDTAGRTCGSLWARAADVRDDQQAKDPWNWVYFIGPGERFMPHRQGWMALHANAGITFNLAAARAMHSNVRPARFRAIAGLADAGATPAGPGSADLWVFVDGRLKFKRGNVAPQDGTFAVDVELGPDDRFLTLVSTDAGDGITSDWLVIGEPLLEMTSTGEEKK